MNNLEKAKRILKSENCTCVLVCGDTIYKSFTRGVRPMADFLKSGANLKGFSAADKVVGKAAAMLFVLAEIKELYAEVITENAINLLKSYGVSVSCKTKTDKIINREKTGPCPMETAVSHIENPEEGFLAIKDKLQEIEN